MTISKKHLDLYCLPHGGHHRCRYLAEDELVYNKYYCLKKVKSKKKEMDQELEEYVKELEKKGITPDQKGIPTGDNCDGFILLKHFEQGYDVN